MREFRKLGKYRDFRSYTKFGILHTLMINELSNFLQLFWAYYLGYDVFPVKNVKTCEHDWLLLAGTVLYPS